MGYTNLTLQAEPWVRRVTTTAGAVQKIDPS
jgi:hypothetical protein